MMEIHGWREKVWNQADSTQLLWVHCLHGGTHLISSWKLRHWSHWVSLDKQTKKDRLGRLCFSTRVSFSAVSFPKYGNLETFGNSFIFSSLQGEGWEGNCTPSPPQKKILVYLDAFYFMTYWKRWPLYFNFPIYFSWNLTKWFTVAWWQMKHFV